MRGAHASTAPGTWPAGCRTAAWSTWGGATTSSRSAASGWSWARSRRRWCGNLRWGRRSWWPAPISVARGWWRTWWRTATRHPAGRSCAPRSSWSCPNTCCRPPLSSFPRCRSRRTASWTARRCRSRTWHGRPCPMPSSRHERPSKPVWPASGPRSCISTRSGSTTTSSSWAEPP